MKIITMGRDLSVKTSYRIMCKKCECVFIAEEEEMFKVYGKFISRGCFCPCCFEAIHLNEPNTCLYEVILHH